MRLPRTLVGYLPTRPLSRRDVTVSLILLVILVAVVVVLARSSTGVRAQNGGTTVATTNLARECTSKGTPFQDIWNVATLEETFRREVSAVVDERLTILKTPSLWVCPTDLKDSWSPPMPKLTALAGKLPGWSTEEPFPFFLGYTVHRYPKPVTFDNFPSIVSELRRAYDCRIGELQENVDTAMRSNRDIDPFGAGFCCTAQDACVLAGPNVGCQGAPTQDPQCDGICAVEITNPDIVQRRTPFILKLESAQTRARVALERTLLTMRSFDTNFASTRELMCYARTSLDLRNVLNLLSDATSCMPKIWDAVTSLHDRAP